MNSIKQLLMLSSRQRALCRKLEAGRGRLYRMVFAWSHNSYIADDVVQETMIKALNNIDKVKNDDALDGWLFRILSNCFIDYCRKQREEIDVDDILLIEQKTPESLHYQDEMLSTVRMAISALPFKHRQVITLIDIESFTYAEVAEIIDAPLGTIMSRLNRARQSLKQRLKELQHEHPCSETTSRKLRIVQ